MLIRGRRLDGAGPLGFDVPRYRRGVYQGSFSGELRIKPSDTVAWKGQPRGSRGIPSRVLIEAPGCYGVQIDGATFSRTVVFSGSIPRSTRQEAR